MVELKDVATVLGALLVLTGAAVATGTLPGNIGFDNPFDTEDPREKQYDLETSVGIQVFDTGAQFIEESFTYSTSRSCNVCLNFVGPGSSLAFGGINKAKVDFQLLTSQGKLVADGSKWIGEVGAFQRRDVTFKASNLPAGQYTVKYRLTYKPDLFGTEQVKTLKENIRVPKRIE